MVSGKGDFNPWIAMSMNKKPIFPKDGWLGNRSECQEPVPQVNYFP